MFGGTCTNNSRAARDKFSKTQTQPLFRLFEGESPPICLIKLVPYYGWNFPVSMLPNAIGCNDFAAFSLRSARYPRIRGWWPGNTGNMLLPIVEICDAREEGGANEGTLGRLKSRTRVGTRPFFSLTTFFTHYVGDCHDTSTFISHRSVGCSCDGLLAASQLSRPNGQTLE